MTYEEMDERLRLAVVAGVITTEEISNELYRLGCAGPYRSNGAVLKHLIDTLIPTEKLYDKPAPTV